MPTLSTAVLPRKPPFGQPRIEFPRWGRGLNPGPFGQQVLQLPGRILDRELLLGGSPAVASQLQGQDWIFQNLRHCFG